jgi:hypothetical protein
MANYCTIKGYITDIYVRATMSGKRFLGIWFYTSDAHDLDSGGNYEIRLWFSSDKAVEISNERLARLAGMAGLKWGFEAKSEDEAFKRLCRPEYAALEVPVTVQPDEYDGRISARYDIGWPPREAGGDGSAFSAFKGVLDERLAAVKAAAPPAAAPAKAAPWGRRTPEAAPPGDDQVPVDVYDDIPF